MRVTTEESWVRRQETQPWSCHCLVMWSHVNNFPPWASDISSIGKSYSMIFTVTSSLNKTYEFVKNKKSTFNSEST